MAKIIGAKYNKHKAMCKNSKKITYSAKKKGKRLRKLKMEIMWRNCWVEVNCAAVVPLVLYFQKIWHIVFLKSYNICSDKK